MNKRKEYIVTDIYFQGEHETIELEIIEKKEYQFDGVTIIKASLYIGKEANSSINVKRANYIFNALVRSGYEVVGFGAHNDLTSWYFQIREFV